MFKKVDSKIHFPQLEADILKLWQGLDIYRLSLGARRGAPPFVFYEGPPTANGLPHAGHALPRLIKDFFTRYKAMRGYYVERKAGWDTHGLPVELEIEKELGLSNKQDIEKYGIAAFNARCKESVFRYIKEWERLTDRIGFWMDLDNAYVTFTTEYIESLWWCIRQMWDKGLLYQDYKVVPYCPRCGTSLSSHEVALGYSETEDPSIFVKFELVENQEKLGQEGHRIYLLVWTTTPWTLPGNVALAVHPKLEYILVEKDGERFILAKGLEEQALGPDYRPISTIAPEKLIGSHYKPLFTFLKPDKDSWRIIPGDFVSAEEGTGIVHIAPAFGAEDLQVAREQDLPILHTVDDTGAFIDAVELWRGMFVKDADPKIIENLGQRGLLLKAERVSHSYPFCWRCDSPLLYYAKSSWFIRTTAVKEQMLKNNELINWYPEHIKRGRFGNWLETVVDWALSRERYWGTPLNIWLCQSCKATHCVGSLAELEITAVDIGPVKVGGDGGIDLHRPYIDQVVLRCPQCGGDMRRVPEVIDCWFDSGAMPVAQWHYPFDNKGKFERSFPGDFICEAIDQTRGWFYTLHSIATMVFDKPAFLHCVVTEFGTDEEGQKMSKHKGNVVNPWPILEDIGADALRWYTYSVAHPWFPRRFGKGVVTEALRRFLLPLWNTYSFFTVYANIDGFEPKQDTVPLGQRSDLDRWILSELNGTALRVVEVLDNYDVTNATRALERFLDDLSNWYIRRSRRRFWKSENDMDKKAAHSTLYECLITLAKLLAPFIPFTTEAIYQNLVRSIDPTAPPSIHLTDYPTGDSTLIDERLVSETELAIEVVRLGRAARSNANIKVRQPLAEMLVMVDRPEARGMLERWGQQILDELNIKRLSFVADPNEVIEYSVSPNRMVLGPKFGKQLPEFEKALQALDPTKVAKLVQAGQPIKVEGWELSPNEIEVTNRPRQGFAVAEDGEILVAIRTELTPELVEEGMAREIIHRVQTMRRNADFRIEEYITTYYQADGTLAQVMDKYSDYIKQETLTKVLVRGQAPPSAYQETIKVSGQPLTIGLLRS